MIGRLGDLCHGNTSLVVIGRGRGRCRVERTGQDRERGECEPFGVSDCPCYDCCTVVTAREEHCCHSSIVSYICLGQNGGRGTKLTHS